MRLALLTGAALAVIAVTVAHGATARDHLTIVVWPEGTDHAPRAAVKLTCRPAGGSLPGAAGACQKLAALPVPFRPVAMDVACAQVFAGPQVALLSGVYRGRRIWAPFRRADSCQAERWKRVAFLFQSG
jgi:hypothetical protein